MKGMVDMYKGQKGALALICDIGCGYDGMDGSIESMRNLVDELVGIARAALQQEENYDGMAQAIFERVDHLYGCTSAEQLFKEYDNSIFYADGDADSVLKSINEEEFAIDQFDYYLFDDWCIAIWKKQ